MPYSFKSLAFTLSELGSHKGFKPKRDLIGLLYNRITLAAYLELVVEGQKQKQKDHLRSY